MAVLVVGFFLVVTVGVFVGNSVAASLRLLTRAARQIAGDLDVDVAVDRRDEVGQTVAAVGEMTSYLRDVAARIDRLADGDLSQAAEPRSEHDRLGLAFQGMSANLRDIVAQLQESSEMLQDSSRRLEAGATHAGSGVFEVTQAFQTVAQGAQDSSRAASATTASVSQLTDGIAAIARGAGEQAQRETKQIGS